MFNYKWHHYTLNRAGGVAVSPGADSSNVVVVRVSLSRAPGPGVPVDRGATKMGDTHEVEREGAGGSGRWPVVGCAGGPEIVEDKTEVGKIFEYPEPDPVVEPEPEPVVEPEPDPVVEPDPDPVPVSEKE